MIDSASFGLVLGFVALSVGLVVGFAWCLRSWRVAWLGAVWLVLSGGLSASGLLAHFDRVPPPVFLFVVPTFLATLVLGLTQFGKVLSRLPVALLVGYQSFRVIVEILIHQAVVEGVAPPQMSWHGMNFDIVTGVSALLLFPVAHRLPKGLLLVCNTLGLGLVLWVVGVAVLSVPGPLQRLTPDNTWVAYFPFVWLPGVMVPAAILGHIALYRKLLGQQTPPPAATGASTTDSPVSD